MSQVEDFLAATDNESSPAKQPESAVASWYNGDDEAARLRLARAAGSAIGPDMASRVTRLQVKTGLPEDLITRNVDEVEKRAQDADFDPRAFMQSSPVVARWMAEHPNNAAIVHDNLDAAQGIEHTIQDFGLMQTMYRALSSGAASMNAGVAKLPAVINNAMLLPYNASVKYISKRPDLQFTFPTSNPVSDFYDAQATALRVPEQNESIVGNANVGGIAKEAYDLNASGVMREIKRANFSRAGRVLAAQFAANAPQQAAIIIGTLAGYGTPALATMGGLQAAQVTSEGQAKGADPTALTVDAVLQGTIEAGFESLGTFGLLKSWENAIANQYGKEVSRRVFTDFAKTLLHTAAGEGNEEFLTQIAQDYADYATGINPDAMKGTFARALDAGLIGAASGATMTTPAAIGAGLQRGAQMRQSTLARDFYLNLGNSINISKINERSPEATKTLLERMTNDSPIEKVYVSPTALEDQITKLGQDPIKVIQEKGLGKAYDEAKRTGTDMQIPLAEWATKAGEFYQSMADDMKFSPESLSVNETNKLREQVKLADEKAKAEAPPVTPVQSSAEQVSANVTEQLKSAGFDEGTAATYSKLYEAAFGTLGQRAGIDPAALFQQYGLQIRRPDIQPTAAPGTTEMAQETKPSPIPAELPVIEEKAKEGEPYAVFDYNWKMSDKTPTLAYFKLFGDPARIAELTKTERTPSGNGWASDVTLDTIQATGIPIKGRTARAVGEPSVESLQASSTPTGQDLLAQQGTAGVTQAMRDQLFPGPAESVSSYQSIALEPDYIKLKTDASTIVNRYATERGIQPTNQFARELWQEMHEALGTIRKAPQAERVAVATDVEAKYPGIGEDFVTLKEQLWSDATDGYYEKFIRGQYQPRQDQAFYQAAYHGSPHKFDQFKLNAIGTGQGAQTYGWGLYFAGKKEVAEGYREQLAGEMITKNFRIGDFQAVRNEKYLDYSPKTSSDYDTSRAAMIENILIDQVGIDAAYSVGGEKAVKEHILKLIDDQIQNYKEEDYPAGAEALTQWRKIVDKQGVKMDAEKQGHVYEVDIPDDKEYLNWDTRLSEQDPGVKAKLDAIPKSNNLRKFLESNPTGADLYQMLTNTQAGVNQEQASRILSEAGIPGIRYLDQGSRFFLVELATKKGKYAENRFETLEQAETFAEEKKKEGFKTTITTNPDGTSNYVIFDDKLVKIMDRYQQGERGMIRFGQDRQFNIDLLKTADLSTFLHETGHFYLEVLGDLATNPNAAPEIKADLDTIYKYLGVESRDQIKREHHEKFARSFEAYLMEGKAPTSKLRAAFARFKSWLTSIYRQIQNLHVELTPEVRDVFDRLLATQEQIQAAQAENEMTPLFTDPKAAGFTDVEAERYVRAVLEAKTEAEDELTTKLMKEARRKQEAWWKDQREKVYKEVAAKVDQQPEQIALSVLQHNTLPDGSRIPLEQLDIKGIKLSKQAIIDQFPDFDIKQFPKPYVYTAEGGLHPDAAAPLFGFRSGSEMLFNILTAENRNDIIKREVDARMSKEFGDLMKQPMEMHEAATKAVHNDKRAELLRDELQHLASNNLPALKDVIRRVARLVPTVESVKAQAEEIIADKRVRDIQPSLYQRAEMQAGREAVEAMLKGDFDTAFEAKQRELLNHELYRAAVRAQDQIERTVDYMSKFSRQTVREKLGKAGEEYLDQIDAIMERFDFRKGVSLRAIDRRKALVNWVEEQRAQGNEPEISDEVLNEAYKQSYKDAPMNVLRGVRDSVRTIEHLATVKNKLLASEAMRQLEAAKDEIVASIQAHHDLTPEPHDFAPSFKKTMLQKVEQFAAVHTRMEFLFEFLDGNKPHGPVWETLFKPMAEAEDVENAKMKGVTENLHRIFGAYTREERAAWFLRRQWIPEINNHMTKANLIAAALNWGNQYNREALMEGYGWTQRQVESLLSRLDERDWKTVQNIWDYIDSFWPEAEALEKDLNGIAPEKVEAASVKTKYGTFKGGYYPIVFDRTLSWRQAVLEEKSNVKEMFGGNWAVAMTKHNHLKERVGTGGKPILLELSGMTGHLADVVHDLSYRRAVIDSHKMLNHPDVRNAIEAAAGKEMYKQLNPWLKAIAGDRRGEPINPVEGLLGRARSGATVVNLGLKLTSGLVQTLGYLNTIKEVGAGYALQGLKETYIRPWDISKQWGFITERSDMMRVRIENWDRDIRDTMKRLSVTSEPGIVAETVQSLGADRLALKLAALKSYSPELQQAFFAFVGYMDLGMSVPTWLAAYRKAMDGGVENIKAGDEKAASEYGDQVVRQTQSSGAAKDNAAIQRGTEAFKLFTMFYSQLSLQFNQFEKIWNQFRLDRSKATLVGALGLLWFLPALLEDLIRGRPPQGDDDDKWLKWLLRKELLYPFNTAILARDVANAADRYMQTGEADFQGSPVFDAFASATRASSIPFKVATGEEIKRADMRAAVNTAGYVFKLPSRQIWMTADYIYSWMTGEQQPQTPVEGVWRALVAGKEK